MKRAVIVTALFAALGGAVAASEAMEPASLDRLAAEDLLPGSGDGLGLTRAALRALSYRAFATFGMNPDKMGPAGCGYHAMLDTVAYAADTAGLGEAMRGGIAMVGGAMDVRAQLCPMTTVLSQGVTDMGFDALGRMNLSICQDPDEG